MGQMSGQAAQRLYQVSRDCYAPALAAFATQWLDEIAETPDAVAMCLGRDGLAPFLAARKLMQIHPRRFRPVHPRRVRLAYVSRVLAQQAAADAERAALLDRYLRRRGMPGRNAAMIVDVGVHGSIQDCLQRIYPQRHMHGRYLVLRRRDGDPNGERKRGFLADLDVAPRAPLAITPNWPLPPGWDVGGTLRYGDSLFLQPRSVHVLEDLWNGPGETAVGLQMREDGAVDVVRGQAEHVLALAPAQAVTPADRVMLKHAASRGSANRRNAIVRLHGHCRPGCVRSIIPTTPTHSSSTHWFVREG
jgi:hypothetical protein